MLPILNDELRQKNVLSWSDLDVGLWLQHLSYPQHLHMFKGGCYALWGCAI